MKAPKKEPKPGPKASLKTPPKEKKAPSNIEKKAPFYIVGMGGSAGGLEAFERFFDNLPPDTGMAFVLVPHQDPTHKSMMPELLQRHTRMKIFPAEDGMKVRPDQVYIIPPNKDMSIFHGTLHLLEPSTPRGLRLPIDFFFRWLHTRETQQFFVDFTGQYSVHAQVQPKAGRRKLADIKRMQEDPAGVEAMTEEIKTRYARLFRV